MRARSHIFIDFCTVFTKRVGTREEYNKVLCIIGTGSIAHVIIHVPPPPPDSTQLMWEQVPMKVMISACFLHGAIRKFTPLEVVYFSRPTY